MSRYSNSYCMKPTAAFKSYFRRTTRQLMLRIFVPTFSKQSTLQIKGSWKLIASCHALTNLKNSNDLRCYMYNKNAFINFGRLTILQ